MTKERLKEIHDSILFQIDIQGKNVFVQEEIDLYNYIKDLEKIIEEAKEYCKSHFKTMVADEEAERLLDILNKTNKE